VLIPPTSQLTTNGYNAIAKANSQQTVDNWQAKCPLVTFLATTSDWQSDTWKPQQSTSGKL
jgi:hypothetical protein